MKQKCLFITILGCIFLAASCINQSNKEYRQFSIEDCYQKNLKDSALMTGWYYVSDSDSGFSRQLGETGEFYPINPYPIVTAEDMKTLNIEEDKCENAYLVITFGNDGTNRWSEATRKSIGKNLALIVNNQLLSVPRVNMEITTGLSNLSRADFSKIELEKVKETIEKDRISMQKHISGN